MYERGDKFLWPQLMSADDFLARVAGLRALYRGDFNGLLALARGRPDQWIDDLYDLEQTLEHAVEIWLSTIAEYGDFNPYEWIRLLYEQVLRTAHAATLVGIGALPSKVDNDEE